MKLVKFIIHCYEKLPFSTNIKWTNFEKWDMDIG